MTPVKIAVIGAGHLGRFHARLAAASDAFDLVAVTDPSESARESLAEETGAKPFADYRDLLGVIDAAVVATPTVTHHAIASSLLENGVHCLVEKPLAPTADEAQQLVELADVNGLVLQVGHVERFNPGFLAARQAIKDPKFITATRTSGYTFRSTDIGAVLDMMIHDIDLVLGIAESEVVDVSAMGFSVLGGHEDLATAQLTFDSGCVAQLTASRVSYEMQRAMQVYTPQNFVAIDFATRTTTTVSPRADVLNKSFDGENLSPSERDELRSGLFDQLLVKESCEAPAVNAIELEQAEFAAAVQAGETPTVTGQVAAEAVSVAERILDAIQEHAWDGTSTGRRGPFALPAVAAMPDLDQLRRAG